MCPISRRSLPKKQTCRSSTIQLLAVKQRFSTLCFAVSVLGSKSGLLTKDRSYLRRMKADLVDRTSVAWKTEPDRRACDVVNNSHAVRAADANHRAIGGPAHRQIVNISTVFRNLGNSTVNGCCDTSLSSAAASQSCAHAQCKPTTAADHPQQTGVRPEQGTRRRSVQTHLVFSNFSN